MNTNTGLTFIRTHEKILWRQRNWNYYLSYKAKFIQQHKNLAFFVMKENDSQLKVFQWWWTWRGVLLVSMTSAQSLVPLAPHSSPSSSSPGPGSTSLVKKNRFGFVFSPPLACLLINLKKPLKQHLSKYHHVCVQCEQTPVEVLCVMAGVSVADDAANIERGSVPSSMELRGSAGAEEEEEDDEEVLPLRTPRRVFVSVTWVEGRSGVQSWCLLHNMTASMLDLNVCQTT